MQAEHPNFRKLLRYGDPVVLPDGTTGEILGGPAPRFDHEDPYWYSVRVGGVVKVYRAEELGRVR